MRGQSARPDTPERIAAALPYLRRHARALAGRQSTGDDLAAEALAAIVAGRDPLDAENSARVALFREFHEIWVRAGHPVATPEDRLEGCAQAHMRNFAPSARAALLLHSVEGFGLSEIGEILGVSRDEAQMLVDNARQDVVERVAGRILIIEDEAIIAFDLREIVAEMGHTVIGVARTRDEAVRLGAERPPHLILADIRLADESSGLDAVSDLLERAGETPVIYVTAYPERLLTGERKEPAFVVSKPYHEDQIRTAVSQAMFFASTETLLP